MYKFYQEFIMNSWFYNIDIKINKLVFKTKILNLKGVGIDHFYKLRKQGAVASNSEMT